MALSPACAVDLPVDDRFAYALQLLGASWPARCHCLSLRRVRTLALLVEPAPHDCSSMSRTGSLLLRCGAVRTSSIDNTKAAARHQATCLVVFQMLSQSETATDALEHRIFSPHP
jgi:hypothetical protein